MQSAPRRFRNSFGGHGPDPSAATPEPSGIPTCVVQAATGAIVYPAPTAPRDREGTSSDEVATQGPPEGERAGHGVAGGYHVRGSGSRHNLRLPLLVYATAVSFNEPSLAPRARRSATSMW